MGQQIDPTSGKNPDGLRQVDRLGRPVEWRSLTWWFTRHLFSQGGQRSWCGIVRRGSTQPASMDSRLCKRCAKYPVETVQ